MILTIFLTIIFCVAITLMMFSAVAFIQDKKFFSSAPKEAQEAILPREKELFYGARTIGWTLMIFSFLMILGGRLYLNLGRFHEWLHVWAVLFQICLYFHGLQTL